MRQSGGVFGRKPSLEALIDRQDVGGLLDALARRERDFLTAREEVVDLGSKRRAAAADALAGLEGDGIAPGLVAALADPSGAVRLAAVRSLCAQAAPCDGELVESILAWPDGRTRQEAGGLLAARAESSPEAAARLARAYLESEHPAELTLSGEWAGRVVPAAGRERRELVAAAVAQAAAGGTDAARARELVVADPATSVPALLTALQDDSARLPAIELLGDLRDPSANPALIELLGAPDPEARRAGADALGQIKHPSAVDALLRATADDDYGVRDAAMRALDRFGTAGAVWSMATAPPGAEPEATDGWGDAASAAPSQRFARPPTQRGEPLEGGPLPGATRRRWRPRRD